MLPNKEKQHEEIAVVVEHCIKLKQQYDLFSPTEAQAKELVKLCSDVENKTGFLYFFLLFVYMPHPTKNRVMMLEASYRWQRLFAYNVLRFRQFIWNKPRQTASTSMALVYFLWRSLFFENQEINIFSLTQRDSRDVLSRIEFVYDNLPVWLKTPTKENQKTSKRFVNESRIRSLPSGKNVGRGASGSAILLDEFAFWDYAETALAAIVPGLSMGLLTPFTNDSLPSQLFLISTKPLEDAGNNTYLRIYHEARERMLSADFNEQDYYVVEVDTSDIPEYNDANWHKIMRTTLGDKKYRVEILMEEPSQFLEDTFLSPEVLEWIQSTTSNPIRCDFLLPEQVDENGVPIHFDKITHFERDYDRNYGYIKGLWIFEEYNPKHFYGIMSDIASAGGGGKKGDSSAFHVIDLDTMAQVAEYRNKISIPKLQEIIETVMLYFGGTDRCKFCVESTGLGIGIAEALGEKYPENFYYHKKSKKEYVPGFPLGTNRGNVLAVFETALERREVTVKSIRTYNELRTFGYKNGKAQALGDSHDDLVLPLAEFTYLRDIFFSSENQLLDEDLEDKEKDEEIKKSANFQFAGREVELRGDALDLYEQGYAIPLDWLME